MMTDYRLIVAITCLAFAGCGEQRHDYRLLTPALEFDQLIAEEVVKVFAEHPGCA